MTIALNGITGITTPSDVTITSSGGGNFVIQPPNSATDRTLTLPDEAGTVLTTAGVPTSAMPSGYSDLRCVAAPSTATNMSVVATFYKCVWGTELIDNYNEFDTSTSKFTASESGLYEITIHTSCRLYNTGDVYQNKLYLNGTALGTGVYEQGVSDGNAQCNLMYTAVVSLSANDYIEHYAAWTGSGSDRTANHYRTNCFWIVRKVG